MCSLVDLYLKVIWLSQYNRVNSVEKSYGLSTDLSPESYKINIDCMDCRPTAQYKRLMGDMLTSYQMFILFLSAIKLAESVAKFLPYTR